MVFKNLFCITLVSLFFLAGPCLADTVPYPVTGDTLEEVWQSIEENGPKDDEGNVWAGEATPSVHHETTETKYEEEVFDPACPGGKGWYIRITWKVAWWVEVTITLPDWPGATSACREVQAEWERFMKALTEHEEQHNQECNNALVNAHPLSNFLAEATGCNKTALLDLLKGHLQAHLNLESDRLSQIVDDANKQFDVDTKHGEATGAKLDTTVTCPVDTPDSILSRLLKELKETQEWGIPKGLTNSLAKKLEGAKADLARDNRKAAAGKLTAFINEVKAQDGKKVQGSAASYLVGEAQGVLKAIK